MNDTISTKIPHKTVKPDQIETCRRIDRTMTLLSEGRRTGEIKRTLKTEFSVCRRTSEAYIARARTLVFERLGKTKRERQAEAMAYWEGVIADPEAENGRWDNARRQLDRLLGLREPTRLEHAGPSGGPILTEPDVRKQMAQIMNDPDAMDLAQRLAEKQLGRDRHKNASPQLSNSVKSTEG